MWSAVWILELHSQLKKTFVSKQTEAINTKSNLFTLKIFLIPFFNIFQTLYIYFQLCQTLFFFHDNDFSNKFYELFKIFILFHQVSEEHATKDLNTIVITVQKLISKNWKNIFMGHCIMQLYWQDCKFFFLFFINKCFAVLCH